jgi:hypothetical protein
MRLYLVTQNVNNHYDTFNAMIVAAKNEKEARHIHPIGVKYQRTPGQEWYVDDEDYDDWASPEQVKVELVGNACKGTERGVILASFNAG